MDKVELLDQDVIALVVDLLVREKQRENICWSEVLDLE